jgi:glycosyltransferase involved in cell wall biosynthesis
MESSFEDLCQLNTGIGIERKPMSPKKNRSVLIIAYKYGLTDPRIHREIAALLETGYQIDYICTRDHTLPDPPIRGVRIFAASVCRKRGNIARYIYEYFRFFLYCFFMTNYLFMRNRYKVIIPFVMPEFLVLACTLPKVFGAKILMDWEDPSIEVFLSKFGDHPKQLWYRLLSFFEKMSVWMADAVITPNEGFRKAFVARGHKPEKIYIVMNAPDPYVFNPKSKPVQRDPSDRFVILYSGSFVHRHGLDLMVKAMPIILRYIPHARLEIFGGPEYDYFHQCRALWIELGLDRHVYYGGQVPISQMPMIIGRASIGVVPNREDAFTRINFPQRILEFGLLQRPIVVPRLAGIEDYMDERSVCFFAPGDYIDLADKIIELYKTPEKSKTLVRNAYMVASSIEWKKHFLEITERLVQRNGAFKSLLD